MSCIMSILFFPFTALWWMLTLIFSLTGRLIAAILGIVLMVVGGLMASTIILLPLGIPFLVLGLLLLARSVM